VLGGPAPLRPAAVVVSPDHLVDEVLPPEDPVEQDLAVMDLAVVDVEIQGAVVSQQASGLLQPRPKPAGVVVKAVGIGPACAATGRVGASPNPVRSPSTDWRTVIRASDCSLPVLNGGSRYIKP